MAVAFVSSSPVLHILGGTTASTTFAASPPAGSTVFLTLGAYDPLSANPVVSDNQGNTWVRLYSTGSLGNNSAMLYVCWAIAGGASLTVTVTANTGAYITGAAAAFTPLVNPANASGTVAADTAATTGQSVSTSAATTQANAVSISVMAQSGPTTLTSYTCSGFTSIWAEPDPNTNQPGGAAYRIETTTGTKTAAWSWASATGENANSLIAVFQGASSGTAIAPGAGSIAFTGFAPTIARTLNQSVTPGAGAVTLTGYAPTIAQPKALSPGAGALSLAGFAPSVTQASASISLTPGASLVTITGFAPSLTQTGRNPYPMGSGGGPLEYFPSQASIREKAHREKAAQWVAAEQAKTRRLTKKATPVDPTPPIEFSDPSEVVLNALPRSVRSQFGATDSRSEKRRREEEAIARALVMLIDS